MRPFIEVRLWFSRLSFRSGEKLGIMGHAPRTAEMQSITVQDDFILTPLTHTNLKDEQGRKEDSGHTCGTLKRFMLT